MMLLKIFLNFNKVKQSNTLNKSDAILIFFENNNIYILEYWIKKKFYLIAEFF